MNFYLCQITWGFFNIKLQLFKFRWIANKFLTKGYQSNPWALLKTTKYIFFNWRLFFTGWLNWENVFLITVWILLLFVSFSKFNFPFVGRSNSSWENIISSIPEIPFQPDILAERKCSVCLLMKFGINHTPFKKKVTFYKFKTCDQILSIRTGHFENSLLLFFCFQWRETNDRRS